MIASDLLMSYRELEGIARARQRIETRLKRESRLGEGVEDLELNYTALSTDFHDFFPQLVAYVAQLKETLNPPS
jgi:acyl carrier protein phosphodiesterase